MYVVDDRPNPCQVLCIFHQNVLARPSAMITKLVSNT
jgi:hypothetical protein